jgi:uncharacterized protein YutE (UPF0331/DUF86 family)
MVDRDLIRRKLADLEQYVAQLAEYRGLTPEEYRRDWRTQRIVERTLDYARLDPARVVRALRDGLEDFVKFKAAALG